MRGYTKRDLTGKPVTIYDGKPATILKPLGHSISKKLRFANENDAAGKWLRRQLHPSGKLKKKKTGQPQTPKLIID